MLFVCYATIDPENREENTQRFVDLESFDPEGGKMIGGWIAVTQQEAWCVVEAESAESVMKVLEPWTDLNVNQVTPVMAFADFKTFLQNQD